MEEGDEVVEDIEAEEAFLEEVETLKMGIGFVLIRLAEI